MKKFLSFTIAVLLHLSNNCNLQAAPFDTGMITLTQPNDVTFTGRIWGDEFFFWAETESGYRFIQSGDGWYYYATLDASGEFTKTIYKVGIDSPPSSSYQLDRTQARIDEINQQIEEFNEQIELNRQWYAQKQAEAQGQSVTLKVGIILIEFQDVKHYENETNRPDGYLTADFDSMMFSYNYWYAPNPQFDSPHPEDELVFGSFRDYWDQMSRGKLKITGKVVNPDNDEDGVPDWLKADHTRAYYADSLSDWRVLAYETIQKAIDSGYVSEDSTDSSYYDKYAVIYAREAIGSGALHVHAERINAKYHFLAERSGPNLYGGNLSQKSFTHVGIYAHEFAHTIGFYDEYSSQSTGQTDIFNFCLMAWGIYNGPDRKAACPATLSPLNRIEWGWLTSIPILQDSADFIVQYSNSNPIVYRIDPVDATGDEHYLIETKKREGFDLYIPGNPADTINQPGRLLIWHANVNRIASYDSSIVIDHMILKAADNVSNDSTQLTDFFPSIFNPSSQAFNDTTMPSSTLGYPNVQNYIGNERPAHFALNGIQKLTNGNTLIEDIKLTYGLSSFTNSGKWQLVSVPLILTDYYYKSVFPTCSSVYKYEGGYVLVDTLENGPGYWANFPTGLQEINMFGDFLKYVEIPVASGWNIIGSINFDNPVANVCTEPSDIIESIYKYENGYVLMTKDSTLKPAEGYWVKTKNAGTLILDRDAEPCELSKITSHPQIDLSEMDKFIITDSEGFSQNLYVSNIDIDTALANVNIDLPPLFPEIEFDSRFEYNEFVKRVSADSGTIDLNILVQTSSYPVSLSWEINPVNGINYSFIGDSILGKNKNIETGSGRVSFSKLNNNRIQLLVKVNETNSNNLLPKEYTLYQNYPNPFNPTTTIKYDIPTASVVSLIIYDILGSEVATLIKEQQQPGRYELRWNASNVSSGIYFYQLKTKDYVDTKKMILLK